MAHTPTLADLTTAVRRFRDDRNWKQFHTPKDLAISIVLEASELLEQFQWKTDDAVRAHLADSAGRAAVTDELADVLLLLVNAADVLEVDLLPAAFDKLARNAAKYPVEKSRGNAQKYDSL